MNTAKHVLVVMGGDGSEREVSLRTGEAMAAALERSGARVTRFSFRRERLAELAAAECDVALIAVHGQDGEDGHLQAMFEMRQIPYSGSGVAASALAIDKVRSKQLFRLHGVPTPASVVVPRSADAPALPMDTPCVVKASREGSSVGVGICQTESAWEDAWAAAMASCQAGQFFCSASGMSIHSPRIGARSSAEATARRIPFCVTPAVSG
jgi:D-alanine-D-alanine ligase